MLATREWYRIPRGEHEGRWHMAGGCCLRSRASRSAATAPAGSRWDLPALPCHGRDRRQRVGQLPTGTSSGRMRTGTPQLTIRH